MLPATKNSSYNLSSPFILYLCHTLKIYKPKYYKTICKGIRIKSMDAIPTKNRHASSCKKGIAYPKY